MKRPLSVRIDADLLATTRHSARHINRTLTNFIETALIACTTAMTAVHEGIGHTPASGDLME